MIFGRKHKDEKARHFTHGSSASTADMAPEAKVSHEDKHFAAPHARRAKPLDPRKKHDQLAGKAAASESRQEALLDEAIEETFPSSDPISPKRIT